MPTIKIPLLYLLLFVPLLLIACDPLAPVVQPTPQIIIVTAEPSNTPPPTATPVATRTPVPSPTPRSTTTPTPFPCEADGGQMLPFDQFESAVANERIRYNVYIPPCYFETQKRYPYVFLIHGAGETQDQWADLGIGEALDRGIRQGALAPMILVMPYIGLIGTDNLFPPDPSYETVIVEELVPAIERDFCTWSDREHRAIGGISRGGFWAFSIGLRHPDVFGILGGHSAAFDNDSVPPEFSPLELALNATYLEDANLRMYLDNGASDPTGATLELFSSRLSSRGIQHTYVINPVGGHDDTYWGAHLSEYLEFYGRDWPRNTSELPNCAEPSP